MALTHALGLRWFLNLTKKLSFPISTDSHLVSAKHYDLADADGDTSISELSDLGGTIPGSVGSLRLLTVLSIRAVR